MFRALSPAAVFRLRAHLRRGGVIAYPTESVYGLGCLPTHRVGLRRLMALKARPQHKGLISIGTDLGQLQILLAPLDQTGQRALQQQWPAAKTFLIPARRQVPAALRGRGRRKIAVRVPAHSGARSLCRQAGSALVSSSCNRAGMRPCRHERDVRRLYGQRVMVLGGRCGHNRTPSQIIDWPSGIRLR